MVGPCGCEGREVENMRISDRIVPLSNGVKSALTSAEPSSPVVRAPVRDLFAAWKREYRSSESGSGGAGVLEGYWFGGFEGRRCPIPSAPGRGPKP